MKSTDQPTDQPTAERPAVAARGRTRTQDPIARGIAVLGLLLSAAGFTWQVYLYRESLAERVSVDLRFSTELKFGEEVTDTFKRGKVWISLVNLGRQPLYIHEVGIDLGGFSGPIANRLGRDDDSIPPGGTARFLIDSWDFVRDPFLPSEERKYVVVVRSSRGTVFRSPVTPDVEFSWTTKP